MNWSALDKRIAPSVNIDTNRKWGFSHLEANNTLDFNGSQLIMVEPDLKETYTFNRVQNQENSLVGTWKAPQGGQVFAFLANGTYLMLDPIGDTMSEVPCGGAGVELGKYTINNTNLLIHSISVDTNQCAGLSDEGNNQTLPFKVEANRLSFTPQGEETFTIDRVQ